MRPKLPPFLDANRSLTGEIGERCSALVEEMEEWELETGRRVRRYQDDNRTARKASVKMLCANLYRFWKRDPDQSFGVSKRKNFYAEERGRLGPHITMVGVNGTADFLEDRGFLEVVAKGWKSPKAKKGIPTQIRATESLIRYLEEVEISPFDFINTAPPIVLKSDKASGKKALVYEDTGLTQSMKAKIEVINRVLLRHWMDLLIPEHEAAELWDKGIHFPDILYNRRTLYRVFNNFSFEEGGRFYGPWWHQIPRKLRPYITIDSNPTVELDYSSMHPRMIYNHMGIECPDDPYDVGLDPKHRDIVKKAFNALINARGQIRKFDDPEDGAVFDDDEMGMTWSEFLNHIKSYHPTLKGHFGTGIGLRFQRIDSDIAETTMLHFAKKNVPILPVHDSFIMHRTYRDELEEVMGKAYEEAMGSTIPIKLEMAESKRPGMIQSETSVGFMRKRSYNLRSKEPTEDQKKFGAYEDRIGLAYKHKLSRR